MVLSVEEWRPYLFGSYFLIKTDHFSLKCLLEQKMTTPFQSKWLPKLMGFDYEVFHRKGGENIAVDDLSMVLEAPN